jgi:hypothetical protein
MMDLSMQFGVTKEATGVEKYLQMQHDQVPFRVRAKRGCATHPRSIAERVLHMTYSISQHHLLGLQDGMHSNL